MTHDQRRMNRSTRRLGRAAPGIGALLLAATLLAGCQVSDIGNVGEAHLAPVPSALALKIDRMGMDARSPIMLRIFKEEDALEVWKRDKAGQYKLLKTYDICAWSGELGPKKKEGDRQAPEGFYTVSRGQMNPNSSYHLSFDLGFPNRFDRSLGRTGSHLMVHGDCSSRGCYAMEDDAIEEIYALAREAFMGGQQAFQVQAFPFRMTPENMAKHANSEHLAFWEMLKEGSDHFEVTGVAPKVDVCNQRYVFNASASGSFNPSAACPSYTVDPGVEKLVAAKKASDLEKRATVIAKVQMQEQREERWAEREAAIAGFFNRARSDDAPAPAGEDAATATGAATATASGTVPVPRVSPPKPAVSSTAVASTSAPAQTAPAQTAPVASTSVATVPSPSAVDAETPVASTAAPDAAAPLGYAAEDDDAGFFNSVAKSSRGLFRQAGKLFN